MKTAPGAQDGIAALRQRLFFASELLRLASRELAGEGASRQGIAMACRQSAVLQLHAVLTGMLDDIAARLRVARAPESLTIAALEAALQERGMVSPELSRIAQLAAGGWLADCLAEIRLCLSASPAGSRPADGHRHDHDDHDDHDHEPAPARSGVRIAVRVAAPEDCEPLSDADLARIRGWIAGWKSLLDEFLVTLDEF